MTNNLKQGVLINIEGIDGAGKSTQAHRLQEFLEQQSIECVRLFEPTNVNFGKKIRQQAITGRVAPFEEMELFLKDREQNVRENIAPALASGKVVILDRYYPSSIAYQGARGLDPDMIRQRNEEIAPMPDLLIYLHIPLSLVEERILKNRGDAQDEFENLEYLKKVKEIFDAMDQTNIIKVDGNNDEATVAENIQQVAMDKIQPLILK